MSLPERLDRIEQSAVEQFARGLTPVELAHEMAEVRGALRSEAITLTTRAWAGVAGELRLARGRGAMDSVTVVAIQRGAPMFSADLVGFGGRLAVVALDLQPAVTTLSAARAAVVAEGWRLSTPAAPLGERWGEGSLLARGPAPWSSALDVAWDAWRDAARGTHGPGAGPDVASCLTDLQHNKREAGALARLFGAQWATRYLTEVMFGPPGVQR